MTIISFLKLVEIQTKVASMLPFLLGTTYVLYRFEGFSAANFLLMLLSLLTFDMTTTALNNYFDYKKAIRTHGYGYESHNAIVKYKLKERVVIATIAMMLITAVVAGFLLFLNTDIVVLLFGMLSFAIGVLYSFGPIPISRTPFGEIFSGFTMGFVITFLAIYIHIGDIRIIGLTLQGTSLGIHLNYMELAAIFLVSVMPICGIANIMLANNICDIEEDIDNKRYTLPIYIGKSNALKVFRYVYYIGYAAVAVAVAIGILPMISAVVFLTLLLVNKNIKAFFQLQTKKDTFILAVKNFVISNAVLVLTTVLGVVGKYFI